MHLFLSGSSNDEFLLFIMVSDGKNVLEFVDSGVQFFRDNSAQFPESRDAPFIPYSVNTTAVPVMPSLTNIGKLFIIQQ